MKVASLVIGILAATFGGFAFIGSFLLPTTEEMVSALIGSLMFIIVGVVLIVVSSRIK